ncbi:ABC transporter substrate-binding protein [Rhizobium sp. CF142]|uniref:ABC transporter substrate-binding protein n=1 Tax=Rhizobium sp. CF142 TaxID=1144314 RepID=UPI00026F008B|nr:ABC transporter substrate-binding protein [Rhizobium sp. CF142]EJJ29823.1 ABC-type nitrate/sulfonate/bicarbonate transport system, periplasmic component [Rhizobium sp. CF142]
MVSTHDYSRLSRRAILKMGAVSAAAGVLGFPGSSSAATSLTTAFGWISNVEYAGFWTALEQGYFAAEGIDAKYLSGGPSAPDTLVSLSAGASQISTANWLPFLDAVDKGNDFVILGASWNKSPAALMSLAKRPVREPKDLVGATILAQNASDSTIIDAILGNAGLPLDYKIVPTGFSPEPLVAGDGDVYLCFATNQPITMEKMGMVEGKDFFVTLMDDMGYKVKQGLLVAPRSLVKSDRNGMVGYLRALSKGWDYALNHPDYAPKIVIEKYGADLGLDPAQQKRQMELQIPLIAADPGMKLLSFDPATVSGSMTQAAKAAGRKVPPPDTIIDLSLLNEI